MSIDRIYNMGDDALTNLFNIVIEPISHLNDIEATIVRIQGFSIPETGAGVYEVHLGTQKITKPSGKVEAVNEFSFDFRVDRNWFIYKGFVNWKNAVINPYTGVIGTDDVILNNRTSVVIYPVTPSSDKIENFNPWRFKGCFVQTVGEIPFDITSGDPIICSITMGFLGIDDSDLGDTS